MKNDELINKIRELGLSKLKEKYVVLERPIQQKFKELKVNGIGFNITQYEIVGVGNLSLMDCSTPFFQMMTFIIDPFYKNIPLFSNDFILKGEKHDVINEIYSTVTNKNDALYKEYIEKFKQNMASCKLTDNETKPEWYDDWRPTFINKTGTEADDEAILKVFEKNIDTLIEFEQKSKYIEDVNERVTKYDVTTEYVNSLVDKGGISTNMFKAALGVEETRKFFHSILFGNECFKPCY